MKSDSIGKIAEALSKAQADMESAKKDSLNPHFKNKYADIAAIIDAVKEPLSKHGLSYSQTFDELNDKIYLTTTLMHISGEWLQSSLRLIMQKPDMQGLGSAATYARRYSLSAMVGIAQDDDDGEGASGRSQKQPYVPQKVIHAISSKPATSVELKALFDLLELTGKDKNYLNSQIYKAFSKSDVSELSSEELERVKAGLRKLTEKSFDHDQTVELKEV